MYLGVSVHIEGTWTTDLTRYYEYGSQWRTLEHGCKIPVHHLFLLRDFSTALLAMTPLVESAKAYGCKSHMDVKVQYPSGLIAGNQENGADHFADSFFNLS